jgi:glyoxylate reductase
MKKKQGVKKVFITRMIPDEGIKMLKKQKGIKVEIYETDKKIPRRELLKRVKGAHIILSILTEKMDAQVMDAAGEQLEMIANYAVGFNNIDLDAAKERGITVSNAPGPEIVESVAEHTIALIFALLHRIVETDEYARKGKYKGWGPMLWMGSDLIGKKLGLIGTGKIGTGVARRLHDGFGIEILYHDIQKNKKLEKMGAKYRTKSQLLKEADIVSIHVPLLESTRHLIDAAALKKMKKTAFLINTSRGPIVHEAALVHALKTKQIAGAGLDVYEYEPRIAKALIKFPNTVLTPHTASATIETRQAMSRAAAANIVAYVNKKKLPNKIA